MKQIEQNVNNCEIEIVYIWWFTVLFCQLFYVFEYIIITS